MGSKETQYYIYYGIYSRSEIVALSAWPPGVNKLYVCIYSNREEDSVSC